MRYVIAFVICLGMGCSSTNGLGGDPCAPALVTCDGAEVDLSSDDTNCGACGVGCVAADLKHCECGDCVCEEGTCEDDTGTCSAEACP